ncbi:hypothetical protein ACHAXN_007294 [Cyclotella atomus]
MDATLSASRRKSLFLFSTIAIYALLTLLMEDSSEQTYHARFLSGQSTDIASSERRGESKYISSPDIHVKSFTIRDALKTQGAYKSNFGFAVYSPTQDSFTLYYPSKSKWKTGCNKLILAFEAVCTTLRDMNITSSQEVVLPISGGDSPSVKMTDCVTSDNYPCFDHHSPVLQFGSGFVKPVIPGEIVMPMPQNDHLQCFQEYSYSGKLCPQYVRRKYYDTEWQDLIPQVVWRGTDFTYLGHYRNLRRPEFDEDLGALIKTDKASAVEAMKSLYDELVPRWKGVTLTAEAEQEANAHGSLPWANIKFSHFVYQGKKTDTALGRTYTAFESSGIPAVGQFMSLDELSQYKYHIDLGGGGGTTWSGTLEKLALPGLLFHHVTPMKDYFHDDLKAWEHYVPVKEDLSDLKEKFDWAEANQEEARRIAQRSTEWVKVSFGEEGFESTFSKFYREPLEALVGAYQHVDDWEHILDQADMKPIMKCSGIHDSQCEQL